MNKKRLKEIYDTFNLDSETIKIVEGLIDGELKPTEVSKDTERWVRQCFNTPNHEEMVMSALSEVLEMHGVEYHEEHSFYYLNSGDLYNPTLIFENGMTKVGVGTVADYAEHLEYKNDHGNINFSPMADHIDLQNALDKQYEAGLRSEPC